MALGKPMGHFILYKAFWQNFVLRVVMQREPAIDEPSQSDNCAANIARRQMAKNLAFVKTYRLPILVNDRPKGEASK
ncbi:MAG TPA: hypothetical protein DEO65_03490 [Bacillus bacterium]|nr:hypothetical protein [Bacillus sp. (in: firmicutes)]